MQGTVEEVMRTEGGCYDSENQWVRSWIWLDMFVICRAPPDWVKFNCRLFPDWPRFQLKRVFNFFNHIHAFDKPVLFPHMLSRCVSSPFPNFSQPNMFPKLFWSHHVQNLNSNCRAQIWFLELNVTSVSIQIWRHDFALLFTDIFRRCVLNLKT